MSRDTSQQIAELEARLARLRERERKRITHEKVLVGSVLMTAALRDPQIGSVVLRALQTGLTRDKEREALKDFMERLSGAPTEPTGKPSSSGVFGTTPKLTD